MKKLVEIAIFTPDVKQTVEFYRKLLGGNPSHETADSAEFKLGDAKLCVHVKDKPGVEPDPSFPSGVDHIASGVLDLDAASAELEGKAVKADIQST